MKVARFWPHGRSWRAMELVSAFVTFITQDAGDANEACYVVNRYTPAATMWLLIHRPLSGE